MRRIIHYIKVCGVISLSFAAFLIVILLWLVRPLDELPEEINSYSSDYLIAHACSSIDGKLYTNSLEALKNSLNNGFKYIELDLYETSDKGIVCLHHPEDYQRMTNTNFESLDSMTFLSHKLYGKYTPITLHDVIKIWEERPFYFVADKISNPQILNKYFTKNRNRVIVEALTLDDYIQLEHDGYIPMFSMMALNVRGLYMYIVNSMRYGKGIPRIVTNSYVNKYVLRIYKRLGAQRIAIYSLHKGVDRKIQEKKYIEECAGREADLVYVDYVKPRGK